MVNRVWLRRPAPGVAAELPARRFRDKWAWGAEGGRRRAASPRPIWINMNSGGEVVMASPVLDRLGVEPASCVFSTESYDSFALLRRRYGPSRVCFPPWDTAWPARRALNRWRPKALVFVLNAYFPVLLRQARRAGVKTILINGLLSRNVERANPFMRRALALEFASHLDAVAVQTEEDARAFQRLGVPAERLAVTGDLSGDLAASRLTPVERVRLRTSLGLREADPVLVVGSAHPGEQDALVETFTALRRRLPQARFIVAPRWVHEAPAMAERFTREGFRVARKTAVEQGGGNGHPYDILILDTFGELRTMYGLGDAAFIGASLVPINERRAGHNPLEPLAHGVVPLYGPCMNLWRGVTRELAQAWPALEVDSSQQLAERVDDVLAGRAPLTAIREAGFRLVQRSGGAVDRTVAFLRHHLT
jgi:3-deoxy-D-manno-octulosonic-acid transferase